MGIINYGSIVEKFGRPQQYENLSVELQDDPEIFETHWNKLSKGTP